MPKPIITMSVEIHYPVDEVKQDAAMTPLERRDAALGALGAHAEENGGQLFVIKSSAFYEPDVQPGSDTAPEVVLDPFTTP